LENSAKDNNYTLNLIESPVRAIFNPSCVKYVAMLQ
jgi:hypothetical protein